MGKARLPRRLSKKCRVLCGDVRDAAGDVELVVDDVTVLNTVSRSLPFPVGAGGEPGAAEEAPREEMRLRHRVLDLRRGAHRIRATATCHW